MKRLKIEFKDGLRIIYTMKDYVPWQPYFENHSKEDMKSAVLQKYPIKSNPPIDLLNS